MKQDGTGLPGGSVVKTLCFQGKGWGGGWEREDSITDQELRSHMPCEEAKRKRKTDGTKSAQVWVEGKIGNEEDGKQCTFSCQNFLWT